jgi:hypothetical protein
VCVCARARACVCVCVRYNHATALIVPQPAWVCEVMRLFSRDMTYLGEGPRKTATFEADAAQSAAMNPQMPDWAGF